jgi:hypothetical protein
MENELANQFQADSGTCSGDQGRFGEMLGFQKKLQSVVRLIWPWMVIVTRVGVKG